MAIAVIVVTNIITNMVTIVVAVMSIITNMVTIVVAVMSIITNMVTIVVVVITTTKIICGLLHKPSDLSFGSLVRTFNFVESHTSCVRFIFRFTNGIRLILSDTVFLSLSLKILQKELPTPFQLVQKVSLLLQGQLLLQLDLI